MPKGRSLHIGVNRVDPDHYGIEGELSGCENDARDMAALALEQGFRARMLLTENATLSNVTKEIKWAANRLVNGDTFLISYAGHGTFINDESGEETDRRDETWCLFDSMLIDDELYVLWDRFKAGVKIIVLLDSCHSGTVSQGLNQRIDPVTRRPIPPKGFPIAVSASRFFDSGVRVGMPGQPSKSRSQTVFDSNIKFYTNRLKKIKKREDLNIQANIVQLSACSDHEEAREGSENGVFTHLIKQVWDGGKFSGTYMDMNKQINQLIGDFQHPGFSRVGDTSMNLADMKPFTI